MEKIILCVFLPFFCASIPFGYLIGKFKGVDVRKKGSGNIGATNVSRTLGKKWGAVVLLLDAVKGFLPVFFIYYLGFGTLCVAAGAFFAVCGHCFTPFLRFKGGKGVATGLGAFSVVCPKCLLLAFLVFVVVFLLRRIVSLSSITAVASYILAYKYFVGKVGFIFVGLAGFVIILRHYQNIIRLIKGQEKPFSFGGSGGSGSDS